MTHPTSSFPEYSQEHLTADARAHFLGAASSWQAAHEALLRGDTRRAGIELDKCIAIATEARKFLQPAGQPSTEQK